MSSTYALHTMTNLEPGKHICWLYDSEEEHRALLTSFLRQGLERGEKVLYIADNHAPETILGYLSGDGLDLTGLLERGQFRILAPEDSYVRTGVFDPDAMIALLREETNRALQEGYSALRVTGEMTWSLRGLPGSERLIEYEAKLNSFFAGSKCQAICQYHRRRFKPAELLKVLATHPIAAIGTALYDNFYYIPPTEFLGPDLAGATLRNWLKNLEVRKHIEEALQIAHEELEQRVRERTAELAAANQGLGAEIAERIQVEESLRESEARLNEAQGIAHIGSWELDLVSNVLRWSDESYRIFEIDAKGFGASYEAFLNAVHPDDRALVDRAYADSVRNRTAYDIVHRLLMPDGRIKFVHERCETFYNRNGNAVRSVGSMQDITERRLLEQQVRQQQRLEAIGRLAGGIAHDFNNLLGVIIGFADLLSDRVAGDDVALKHIKQIRKAGDSAANLTRQLLAFSRKQVLEPRVLDLNGIIFDMSKMLQRLISEDIKLVTVAAPDLGQVKADPGQIEQVILNLVVNARDSMPKGGKLTVETANVVLDESYARAHIAVVPGRYAMVAVSDTGMGMDAETQARIFEPFFTTKKEGTGLGLATVYGIVKQSGGNIWVYSEPGKGTTFKVYLPRVEEKVEVTELEIAKAPAPGGTETILVAEDSESLRTVAREFLEGSGYTVLEASDGTEALHVAEQCKVAIHLLLTDVVMPGMGGNDLAARLRESHPETRVLYVSGYTDDAIVHHGILAEGVSLLTKPFTRESLARKVRQVLDS